MRSEDRDFGIQLSLKNVKFAINWKRQEFILSEQTEYPRALLRMII